jgi:hypothetical protein
MSIAINESRITIAAEKSLKDLEAALLRPLYNAKIRPKKSLIWSASSPGEDEVKKNHPLIPVAFRYMEECKESDRGLVNTVAQLLVITLVRVFRCGAFNPREYSLEILKNRWDLLIAYSEKTTEKEVSSDEFDKDKCFLAEFWYAWNCKDSFLFGICYGDPNRASRMETCRKFMRDLLYDYLSSRSS